MKSIKILFSVIVLFTFFSCQKSEIIKPLLVMEEPQTITEIFGQSANHSFIGSVIDKNENPIINAKIEIGNSTTRTDRRGVFILKDAGVYENFAHIKVTKPGFINSSRSLVPVSGINRVTIMMLNTIPSASINSGIEETVSLLNGASITLLGQYEYENGSPYSGVVDVVVHHLAPSDRNIDVKMPGMLLAENSEDEARVLQTYGMLAIELRGNTGEKLQIAQGSSAEIKMPLDSSFLTFAPETIKLWYFDEDKGYWLEDGTAKLEGNFYVGTVKHFSFWNCDADFPTVNLCIHVKDTNENPIANQLIKLSFSGYPYPRIGFTNNAGEVCGLVPSNETIVLKAYNSAICGNSIIYENNIGPFSKDSSIDITIPLSTEVIAEKVVGVFTNCDGDVVTNGYVMLNINNNTFLETVVDGDFEIGFIRCQEQFSFSIEGVDFDTSQTTSEINYAFTTPLTDLGTISSCNTASEFIQYTIDGEAFYAVPDPVTFTPVNEFYESKPTLRIDGIGVDCFYSFAVLNPSPYTGSYPFSTFGGGSVIPGFEIIECIDMSITNNNVTFNLTTIGEVGEYIDINFSGNYQDTNGNAHSITGTIHAIRD